MTYIDFHDQLISLSSGSVEIDADSISGPNLRVDIAVVFNPANGQTYKQAGIICVAGTFIPIKSVNDPEPVLLEKGKTFDKQSFTGYTLVNAWQTVLARKILSPTPAPWTGGWKDVSHKYVPFMIEKGIAVYYGWLELSFDSVAETITLHRSACALNGMEYNKAVTTGE